MLLRKLISDSPFLSNVEEWRWLGGVAFLVVVRGKDRSQYRASGSEENRTTNGHPSIEASA